MTYLIGFLLGVAFSAMIGHFVWRNNRARRFAPLRPMPSVTVDEANHPEVLALRPFCRGRGIDVGCGHRKIAPECIGVDVVSPGDTGRYGVVAGRVCVADVQASGDDLPMFRDEELDYVVSNHNLEHYVDVVRTLEEWRRILRPGGTLAVVVPDEREGDTVFLDPTHKHGFTPESLKRLLRAVGGFEDIRTETAVPRWSFLLTARKSGPAPAG